MHSSQEVFRGPFGVVVAESIYEYPGPEYDMGSLGFSVRADHSLIRREMPKLIDELPPAAEPLNSITIIRISNLRGVDVVAVATYSERGELFNVAVDSLKPGVYVPSPAKPQMMDEAIRESIRQFDFPLTVAVDEYRKKPTPLYQRTDGVPLTVVSFHYARNRWVEQHIFHDASSDYEKRFLEFRYTAQDDDLRFFDRDLTWAPANDQRMSFGKK